MTAGISDNRIRNNKFGVMMDAGFAERNDPRSYAGTLDLTFEDNEIAENILAPALISFTRFPAAMDPAELSKWKYLQTPVFDIKYSSGELDGYWFDHPETDRGRELGNIFKVNVDLIPNGRFIPFN